MGLMDKVKAQASQLAEKAEQAGKAGQAKLEALQAKRRADGLLADLGAIVYGQRVGKSNAGDEAKINDLVGQLRQYEAEYGAIGDNPGADIAGDDNHSGGGSDNNPGVGGMPADGEEVGSRVADNNPGVGGMPSGHYGTDSTPS